MSYGDDFASVDTAGAPLDPTIMIGADPMFWGAVLLALAVAALIGWLVGRSRAKGPDAAGAIWEAIDDAAKAAMKADTEALPARASELKRMLDTRLGRTLAFGGGLHKCVEALGRAVKGEEDHKSHPRDHAAESDASHGSGGHGAPEPGHGAAPSNAAASVTIVSVHAPQALAPPPAPAHGKRPMTTKERNDALRLAVADFNDHWRHRSAREGDMRAVIAELSDPGPRRPHLSHGGHH